MQDAPETRHYWKTRSLAIGLTFSVGCLLVIALGLLLVDPRLSAQLTEAFGMAHLWPYVRWAVAVGCTVLAVELLLLCCTEREVQIREHTAGER